MIINVRGTSGSGKSTLVRKIMSQYLSKTKIYEEGRKQPIGYKLEDLYVDTLPLYVLGHYETDCGGCDTIKTQEHVYNLVREASDRGCHVLYEGLLLSGLQGRVFDLVKDGYPVTVIGLTTDVDTCLESVNERRKKRLKDKFTPVNPANTIAKKKAVDGAMKKFMEGGVNALLLDRDAAYEHVKSILLPNG